MYLTSVDPLQIDYLISDLAHCLDHFQRSQMQYLREEGMRVGTLRVSRPNVGISSLVCGTELKFCIVGSAAFKLLWNPGVEDCLLRHYSCSPNDSLEEKGHSTGAGKGFR